MPWPRGDSGKVLRDALKTFMTARLKEAKYKSLLPKQHVYVVKQGEKQNAGINIVIVTQTHAERPWIWKLPQSAGVDAGKQVRDEKHRIALVVKGDQKSGGAEAVNAVHNVISMMFECGKGTPEKAALITAGVFNVFEDPEGLAVDPGSVDSEGTAYTRQLSLTCTTSTLLN